MRPVVSESGCGQPPPRSETNDLIAERIVSTETGSDFGEQLYRPLPFSSQAMGETTTELCERMSHRVVTAVADREGVDPVELTTPLYEAVDPDALDSLFRYGQATPVSCTFSYCGYHVEITPGREVVVHDGPVTLGSVTGDSARS